jgi:hypothetical protein
MIYSYTLHHRNPERATYSANKKQGKREKQILIGLSGLGSGMGILSRQVSTLAEFLRKSELVSI